MLRLKGSQHFRQRLALATILGRAVRIDDIRSREQDPGLKDSEISLLRLFEKISSGCIIEINETGTRLQYRPGVVRGGDLQHECNTSRAIGYYLEPLVLVALFGKGPLQITLKGVTNNSLDPGIDTWRTVTLPVLKNFVGAEELEDFQLKVHRRGCSPQGGGEVWLHIPIIQSIPYINRKEEGMVKRIRGIAYSAKVSPQISNRLVDGARGILNDYLADVFIFTDHVSGADSGLSPGFGLTLVAETTAKNLISAEASADVVDKGKEQEMIPEEVGRRAANALLKQIQQGGVVDTSHQGLAILLCALGPEEINELRIGTLTPYAIRVLRNVKEFMGITFSIRPEQESQTIFLGCIGAGIKNIARKLT